MILTDLHLHSNNSDGSDSISELAENIQKAKLSVFALTDHDTIDGCAEMAKVISPEINFISGVELTCKVDSIKCHILGYNCDYNNPTLLELINKGKILRSNKLEVRIKYLKDTWGITLTQDELDWLYSRRSVVKTHLANILVKRGLAKDNLSAMQKYLDGCKSGDTRFSGEEAINAIIKSGGIPVWAHPLGGEGEAHMLADEFIPKLKTMMEYGIQGLECYYSRYNMGECEFLADCAEKNKLLVTAGSDYHGANKNNIKIGQLNCENKNIDIKKISILNYI